jgi:hypothetical protein
MRLTLAFALLIGALSLADDGANSATKQFQMLQEELRSSHTAKDWPKNLVSARELKTFLNENPSSLLEVTRAEVQVGDFKSAFSELNQFVRMGQTTDLVARSKDFSTIAEKPEFAAVRSGMEANRSSVSRGSTAFALAESGLLAEDVDYDPSGHRFLVTSVRQKKIVVLKSGGDSGVFATAPDNWPVFAIRIDRVHGLVWATEVAVQGFAITPKPDWGRSAVLCYDLKSGKLLRRVEGPRGGALGDLTLMVNGDVVVSDGEGGGVYRLTAKGDTLDRLDDGDFISPQTPAMHPDGRHIFVPDYERGIGVLDIATRQVRWLAAQGRYALNGIDGLYFDRGRLFAVQNGTSPERVVVFTLDAKLQEIISETILERSTGTLGDPTHGTFVGKDFYYIANSGWDVTDERGNIKPEAKPSEPRVMRVRASAI